MPGLKNTFPIAFAVRGVSGLLVLCSFPGHDPVVVMSLARRAKHRTITGPSPGNGLPATRGTAFGVGRTCVDRAFFGGDKGLDSSVGKTFAADGPRDGLKQRIKLVV